MVTPSRPISCPMGGLLGEHRVRASFRAKGQAEKGRAGRPWVMRHERQGSELKCAPGSVERKTCGVSHASRESRQSSHLKARAQRFALLLRLALFLRQLHLSILPLRTSE